MPFQWIVPPNQAFPALVAAYTRTIIVSGRRVAHQRAEDATAWMKENAPWTDQTGVTREGLNVQVLESPGVLAELVFQYGEDEPGLWLEIANAGRYSIIPAAIDYWGPKLMMDVQRIVNLGLAAR